MSIVGYDKRALFLRGIFSYVGQTTCIKDRRVGLWAADNLLKERGLYHPKIANPLFIKPFSRNWSRMGEAVFDDSIVSADV